MLSAAIQLPLSALFMLLSLLPSGSKDQQLPFEGNQALLHVPEAVCSEAAVELPLLVDLGDRARLLAIALK